MHFEKRTSYSLASVLSFSMVVLVCNLNLVSTVCILSTFLGIGVIPYVSDDSSYSLNMPLSSKTPMSTTSNYTLEEKEGMDKHSSPFAGALLRTVTKIRRSGVLHMMLPPHLDKMLVKSYGLLVHVPQTKVPLVSIALFV